MQQEQQMQSQQIEAQNKQIEASREFELLKQKNEIESNERIAYMNGLSKAVDTNATIDELNLYKIEAGNALAQQKIKSDIELKQNMLAQKATNDIEKNKLALQQLGLKAKEVAIREKEAENKKFGDIINKN